MATANAALRILDPATAKFEAGPAHLLMCRYRKLRSRLALFRIVPESSLFGRVPMMAGFKGRVARVPGATRTEHFSESAITRSDDSSMGLDGESNEGPPHRRPRTRSRNSLLGLVPRTSAQRGETEARQGRRIRAARRSRGSSP